MQQNTPISTPATPKAKLNFSIYVLLALLGALHSFSFALGFLPAWFLPFLQICLFSIFTIQIYRAPSVKSALLRSWVFAFSFLLTGIIWLQNSMHVYGHMPVALAVLAVALFAAALAIIPALSTALFSFLQQRQTRHLGWLQALLLSATWASCWTLAEWVRGTLFTGFPWLNIAYAHLDGPFIGWAPLMGAYGLAWIAAFTSAAIATLVIYRDTLAPQASAGSFGLACLLALLGLGLQYISWSRPNGEPFIARLVQGNISQAEKFDPNAIHQGIQHYYQLASTPSKDQASTPSLIVLPETVIPLFQDSFDGIFWLEWVGLAKQFNAQVLLGIPLVQAKNDQGRPETYTNSLIAIDPTTQADSIIQADIPAYHKYHLVPFGEFIPPGFRWFVDMMQVPLGDFTRGDLPQSGFTLATQRIAPNICFEDVFGEEIRQAVLPSPVSTGANVLVNVSNLAWFSSSRALYQHLQFSRLRAIETARPMLRATNTGITAAIDADGYVRAALSPQQVGILDVEVQGRSGLTPYVKWGNWPALALIWLFLIVALLPQKAHQQAKDE